MAPDTQNLSPAQKELIAVGASVGAGCHPCVSHHLKAGAQAGLDAGQLLAAVAGAEAVASEATVLVADHARGKVGQTAAATLSPLEDALAALGAALGANDAAAIDLQLRAALDLGVSKQQLREAIATAKNVQENAGRIHARKADELLDEITVASPAAETDAESDGGCGCSDTSEAATKDPATEGEEAKNAAARGFGCKPPRAEVFASAGGEGFGPAAMIDHCRQMFAGASGNSEAPTETSAAAAEPAGGSGGKEVRR